MATKRIFIVLALAVTLMAGALPAAAGLYEWSRLARLEGTSGPEPAVSALAAHPTNPAILYAGVWLTTGGADLVYRSGDGGQTWLPAAGGLPDDLPENTGIEDLVLLPGNPPALYAAVHQRGVWRSDDGGATWESVNDGSRGADEDVAALVFAPGAASGVFALSTDGVSLLADGKPWQPRANGLPEPGTAVFHDLAIDPTNPDILYVATSPAGLFRSRNGGTTWVDSNGNLPGGVRNIKGVAVDANGTVFLTLRGAGLFRSTDGGESWNSTQEGITFRTTLFGTVSAPVFDPAEPNVAFAFNNDGVFRSEDGGATWQPYSAGLTSTAFITTLAFQPARPHTTLGGTSISGVWTVTDAPGGRYYVPVISR